MLPYSFGPSVFLRAPSFSVNVFGMGSLQDVLDTSFFRSAFYFASVELYRQAKLKFNFIQIPTSVSSIGYSKPISSLSQFSEIYLTIK